jgi:hypothetical protein
MNAPERAEQAAAGDAPTETSVMHRARIASLVAIAALLAGACRESTSARTSTSSAVSEAFLSIPAGYDLAVSSFAGGASNVGPWMPTHFGDNAGPPPGGGMMGDHMERMGPHGVFDPGLMGGGLGPDFLGGIGFGRGFHAGPFHFEFDHVAADCTFDSATGRVTCPTETRGDLSIDRSFAFLDATGQPQLVPDNTTNSINVTIEASGTITRRDGASSTIRNTSDRTVTGLADGSTERTVNGASRGEETTTGTSDQGDYTAMRVAGDTTTAVVIPLSDGHPTFPVSGTVVRAMRVTVTIEGQSPATASRREVITYDGSSTATLVITQDGATKNCTLPLPFGRPNCL